MPTARRAEPRDADLMLALQAELGRPPPAADPDPRPGVFPDLDGYY